MELRSVVEALSGLLAAIGTFLSTVGGLLALDRGVIRDVQAAPGALSFALTVLVLAGLSDAVGNSPLLFVRRVPLGHFLTCLAVSAILFALRAIIWVATITLVARLVFSQPISLEAALVVLGIGFAPLLLSFVVLIPMLGPFLGKVLNAAWTLVLLVASLSLRLGLSLWQALAFAGLGLSVTFAQRRTVDRLLLRAFRWLSLRSLGVNLMARTEQIDILGAITSGVARHPGGGSWPTS